jgi:hypothetical protein
MRMDTVLGLFQFIICWTQCADQKLSIPHEVELKGRTFLSLNPALSPSRQLGPDTYWPFETVVIASHGGAHLQSQLFGE